MTLLSLEWANGIDGGFRWIDSAARSENAPYRRWVGTRGSILDAPGQFGSFAVAEAMGM